VIGRLIRILREWFGDLETMWYKRKEHSWIGGDFLNRRCLAIRRPGASRCVAAGRRARDAEREACSRLPE
jgi:hypothetical protein